MTDDSDGINPLELPFDDSAEISALTGCKHIVPEFLRVFRGPVAPVEFLTEQQKKNWPVEELMTVVIDHPLCDRTFIARRFAAQWWTYHLPEEFAAAVQEGWDCPNPADANRRLHNNLQAAKEMDQIEIDGLPLDRFLHIALETMNDLTKNRDDSYGHHPLSKSTSS